MALRQKSIHLSQFDQSFKIEIFRFIHYYLRPVNAIPKQSLECVVIEIIDDNTLPILVDNDNCTVRASAKTKFKKAKKRIVDKNFE